MKKSNWLNVVVIAVGMLFITFATMSIVAKADNRGVYYTPNDNGQKVVYFEKTVGSLNYTLRAQHAGTLVLYLTDISNDNVYSVVCQCGSSGFNSKTYGLDPKIPNGNYRITTKSDGVGLIEVYLNFN